MASRCTEATEYRWPVTDLDKVRRYLLLGCETGTYYGDPKRQPATEKSESLESLLASEKGIELIKELSSVGLSNPIFRHDFALSAYLQCARHSNVDLRKASYSHLDKVIRNSQDLLQFVALVDGFGKEGTGWGRSFRRALSDWFNKKDPVQLARITTQHRRVAKKRWDHRDVLRMAHVKPKNNGTAMVLKYLVKGLTPMREAFPEDGLQDDTKTVKNFLEAVEEVRKCDDEQRVTALVEEHRLLLDHVNPRWHKSKELWSALVQHTPLREILPNLGRLTHQGLFIGTGGETARLCDRLGNEEELEAAKLHPYDILQAWKSYRAKKSGRGDKGKIKWDPNKLLLEAIEAAITKSFKFVQPMGKRFFLAIDVSSSMKLSGVNGSPGVTAMEAVALLAMQIIRKETDYKVMAFSKELKDIPITPEMNLEATRAAIGEIPMGSTDISQPLQWALQNKAPVDVFITITDCETSFEETSSPQSLREYRKGMGIDAKLVVIALASNKFEVADPTDGGMLDMAGFNTNGPEILRKFATGQL